MTTDRTEELKTEIEELNYLIETDNSSDTDKLFELRAELKGRTEMEAEWKGKVKKLIIRLGTSRDEKIPISPDVLIEEIERLKQ